MAGESITCPDCGLVVTVNGWDAGPAVAYDIDEWRRVCKHRDLGEPSWCFICRGSAHPTSTGGKKRRIAGEQRWLERRQN